MDFSAQDKQDRDLLQATHDKLATLGEDYGHLDAKFTETKGLVESSLLWIRSDLDQNKETMKQHVEILSLTRATVDEQTCRLDDHDTKLYDQQSASFFGSKNSLEKLDKFKEKQDRLSLRVLEIEDWMRAQAPKNLSLDPPGARVNEGTSKYIPPNECARANPKGFSLHTRSSCLALGHLLPREVISPCLKASALTRIHLAFALGLQSPREVIFACELLSNSHDNVEQELVVLVKKNL
ncbi:hypothetical protein ACLB2K_065826 [Fragaria x ananassa]